MNLIFFPFVDKQWQTYYINCCLLHFPTKKDRSNQDEKTKMSKRVLKYYTTCFALDTNGWIRPFFHKSPADCVWGKKS